MFMDRLKDPRVIGFLAGFAGVTTIGVVLLVAWGILSNGSPTPTLVPSAVPVAERVTVVPSATGEEVTPSPTSDTPSSAPTLPSPTEPLPTPSPTRTESIEYTVRDGDTLFGIALAHGVSVETLQAANDLTGETIVPGQVLIIPPGPLPTPTSYVEGDAIVHTVSSGETLIGIAKQYSVTVELIQTANDLESEIIQPGWELRIPVEADQLRVAAATTTAETEKVWQPSILEGNLEEGYPLTLEGERFTLHYQPDTPAARAPNQALQLIQSALDYIETGLDVTLEDRFDVYLAGSFFPPPDMALRGRSFSSQRRNFYLYDDTGTPEERRYIITHELTHMVAWNTIGPPSSVMLHEGVAVYTGVEALEAAGFIPLTHFCAAYQQAGELPRLSGSRTYSGHIRDLDLYFTAGCFVQYLIEQYGLADFKQLFTGGDYPGLYGATLAQLEPQWTKTLEAVGDELDFDPEELVAAIAELGAAYDQLFSDFNGTSPQMAAYRELDQARIAVLQARFDAAQEHLDAFAALLEGG
jgi:LysM repeat protein